MTVLQSGLAKSLAEDYTIDQSLRFNFTDDGRLDRVLPSAGDRESWTFSCWFKVSGVSVSGDEVHLFSADDQADQNGWYDYIRIIPSTGKLQWNIVQSDGSGVEGKLIPTMVFRDVSAWYHGVFRWDSANAAAGDRMRIWINGDEVTAFDTDTNPAQDHESLYFNNLDKMQRFGNAYDSSAGAWDSYIAEAYFIDGQSLDADSFGETDSATNQWKPKDASGLTFGTNGFYQKYAATELANSFTDSAGREPYTLTADGNTHTDTTTKKVGTASAEFDGTGDYLSVGSSSALKLGNNSASWTIEFWINLDTTPSDYIVIDHRASTMANGGFSFYTDVSEGGVGFDFSNGSAWAPDNMQDPVQNTLDTWYHYAVVQEGDRRLVMYRNGTLVDESTELMSDASGTYINWFLGGGYNASGSHSDAQYMDGFLDEVRVSNIARYVEDFTAPTTAFTSDTNTLLLLHMDGSDDGTTFTDSADSPPRHTITAYGNVANTRAQKKVGDSSIVFDGTGDYLSIPNSTDWDLNGTGDFTVEFWVRMDDVTVSDQGILSRDNSGGIGWIIPWQTGTAGFQFQNPGNNVKTGVAGFSNDTWYHIAICRSSGTLDIYQDGVSKDSESNTTDLDITSTALNIGRFYVDTDNYYFSGYLDEIRISDSARYTGNFTPQTTEFTTDSNTLLLIHSNWDGGLGADSSGNYNTFSVTNLVATDQMVDSPTNNFCTLNPLLKPQNAVAYSEGNLQSLSTGAWNGVVGTAGVGSGKWYWEQVVITQFYSEHGIVGNNASLWFDGGANPQTGTGMILYGYNGKKNIDNTETTYGATFTSDDIIGVALNMDDSEVTFYKNNATQGAISFSGEIVNASLVMPCSNQTGGGVNPANEYHFNAGQDSSFAGNFTAQGNADGNGVGDFYYEPPTDFLALCSSNLPDPEIKLPGDNFNTKLFEGNNTTGNAQTGIGFQPDFIWFKNRDDTNSHALFDSVRGRAYGIASNSDSAQDTSAADKDLASFDSDGFTVGVVEDWNSTNKSGDSLVAWNWLAATTFDPATAGTVTTGSGRSNSTAGFSIVGYTGESSAMTIGHGLAQAPEMVIVKNRTSTGDWIVGADAMTSWVYSMKFTTAGEASEASRFNSTAPTATVFSVGTSSYTNEDTSEMIAYCFHSIEGYSKVGKYIGNNNADGAFIYTGFRPAFFMIKDIGRGSDWYMIDNKRIGYNANNYRLQPNQNRAEVTTIWADFVSNGIKLRTSDTDWNPTDAEGVLFYAAAESPFKYANAR